MWGTRCFSVVHRPEMDVAFKATATVADASSGRGISAAQATDSAQECCPALSESPSTALRALLVDESGKSDAKLEQRRAKNRQVQGERPAGFSGA